MAKKIHKYHGYELEVWAFGSNFAWAVVGSHEDGKRHIAGGNGVAATEHEAEHEAKSYIDAWRNAGNEGAGAAPVQPVVQEGAAE